MIFVHGSCGFKNGSKVGKGSAKCMQATAIGPLKGSVFLFFAGHVLAARGTAPARVTAQHTGSARLPSVQPGHPGESGAPAVLLVEKALEAGPGEQNVFLAIVVFFIFYLACLLQYFC